jgi:hypothetical protein
MGNNMDSTKFDVLNIRKCTIRDSVSNLFVLASC